MTRRFAYSVANYATCGALRAIRIRMPSKGPILLFDGVCNLCNSTVDFIVRHDPGGVVKFGSLQSRTGRTLLAEAGLPDDYDASLVLFEDGQVYTSSDAALRVARYLDAPWSWSAALRIVPRPLRDVVYRWVSRNRYQWFGRRDTCRLPTEEERARFIDTDPVEVNALPSMTG